MDMTYRERIEKYKKHQLTEEENREVEAEIEKTEAIQEYLSDLLMEDLSENFSANHGGASDTCEDDNGMAEDAAKDFETYVKKSIHKSFRKMGIAVGSVVLAVVLFVQFGMSPLMSAFYYNPAKASKVTTGEDDMTYTTMYSQIGTDFHVYAQLALPCRGSDYVQALPMGYGNYQIILSPSIGYGTERRTATAGTIRKGELELYNPDYFHVGTMNYFVGWGLNQDEDYTSQMEKNVTEQEDCRIIYNPWFYGTLEDGKEAIDDLEEDDSMYQAYVSFDRLHSFTEVNEILNSMEEQDISLSQIWVAVCGDETGKSTVGYDYDNQQGNIPVSLNKTYPELTLFEKDGYDDEDYENADKKSQDETVMTQHLVSMLNYMEDQHKFTKMMEKYIGGSAAWKSTADYIEENGITSYGFVCITDKESMQKMLEMDSVIGIVPEKWNV